MEVAIDLSPLVTKLLEEETLPLGLLQVLTLVKANPGISQSGLIKEANLKYTRQALNGYIKKLTAAELMYLTPDEPGAKNKQLWLTTKGSELVGGLEDVVTKTLKVS